MSGIKFMGKDSNGLAKALSVETDANGNGVLRVVDAAPFAYNPLSDALKTMSTLKVKRLEPLADAEVIAAGGKKVYSLIAPNNRTIIRPVFIQFNIPAISGATTGTHQVVLRYANQSTSFPSGILRGQSTFDKAVRFMYGGFTSSVTTKEPSDPASQIQIMQFLRGLLITDLVNLHLVYENNTDAPTSAARDIYIVYTEEEAV